MYWPTIIKLITSSLGLRMRLSLMENVILDPQSVRFLDPSVTRKREKLWSREWASASAYHPYGISVDHYGFNW